MEMGKMKRGQMRHSNLTWSSLMHLTLHVVRFAPSSVTLILSNLFSVSSLQVHSLCLDLALALPLLLVLPVVQLHNCKLLTSLLSRPLSL